MTHATRKRLRKAKRTSDCSSLDEAINKALDRDKDNRALIVDGCDEIAKLMMLDADHPPNYKEVTNLISATLMLVLNDPTVKTEQVRLMLLKYIEGE